MNKYSMTSLDLTFFEKFDKIENSVQSRLVKLQTNMAVMLMLSVIVSAMINYYIVVNNK